MSKSILSLLLVLISFQSCAMGSKPVTLERKDQDKLFRPCQDFEVSEPIGKLCNRVCIERSGSSCSKWKTTVKDFSNKETFLWFRAGSFVMIDEDQVF